MKPSKTPKLKMKLPSEPSGIQAAVNELKELNNTLVNVSAPIPRDLEDECDVIGRHVALQLKQLPPIDRIDATDEIQAIISRYRKSALCARIVYSPSNHSSECTRSPQPVGFTAGAPVNPTSTMSQVHYQNTISALSTQLEQSSQSILHNECMPPAGAPVNPQSILNNDVLAAAITISDITNL